MTYLYWLSFADPEKPKGQQFLGAAVVEIGDADIAAQRLMRPGLSLDRLCVAAAVQKAWMRDCNPGGDVRAMDITDAPQALLDQYPRHTVMSFADLQRIDVPVRMSDGSLAVKPS